MSQRLLLFFSGVVAVTSAAHLFVEPENNGNVTFDPEFDSPTVPLFSPINPDTVVQQRWMEFDWSAFNARSVVPLTLNLFENAEAKIVTTSFDRNENGIMQWRASLVGREYSPYPSQLVVSMIDGEQINGHATIGLRSFTFHSGSVYTRITETDQSKYPAETHPVHEEFENNKKVQLNDTMLMEADLQRYTISLLVLQPQPTQQACNRIRNQLPQIQALYQNHMDATWTRQYGVGVRVFAECLVYTSVGNFNRDLSFIRGSSAVALMRNQYAADLVTMMITGGSACGIGYLPSLPVSPSDVNQAFTVNRADCAIDNWTLVHELGHNMGLQHDRFVVRPAPNVCNFGGHAPSERAPTVRSIMAYANYCNSLGRSCRRLGSYSDGRQTSGGLGRPCASSTGEIAVEYWRQAVPVVANYR